MAGQTIPARPRPETAAKPLLSAYQRVRQRSHRLCETLHPEDCVLQSMTEASPTRWHLAHSTWFFETLVLKPFDAAYRPFHPDFEYLFNSYYNTVGDPFPRPRRGLLSRPTMNEVWAYRGYVDERMTSLISKLESSESARAAECRSVIEVGLHHEQQHQELILTDIKHAFAQNPIFPAYRPEANAAQDATDNATRDAIRNMQPDVERDAKPDAKRDATSEPADPPAWIAFEEGLRRIGHGGDGFCYDNEMPRHREFVEAFALADRLVTNAEYLEFIHDGGYERPELWLSDGWAAVCEKKWRAPLYWYCRDDTWLEFTLTGLRPLRPA